MFQSGSVLSEKQGLDLFYHCIGRILDASPEFLADLAHGPSSALAADYTLTIDADPELVLMSHVVTDLAEPVSHSVDEFDA